MRCAECDQVIEVDPLKLVQDYLCPGCRAALEPEIWDDRERVTHAVLEWLRNRGQVYHGYEIMFPESSPWAWVKVYIESELADTTAPYYHAANYDQYLTKMKVPSFVVWKRTGCVYEIGSDGAVPDDPIFTPSWA